MRAPAFAITGVLILTFGIGLNLTLFQFVHVILLTPPDIPHPETLARFTRNAPGDTSGTIAYPITQAVARENTVMSTVLVESMAPMMWGDEMQAVTALFVSPNWFVELGGTMEAGRAFAPALDGATSPTVAVVSHLFWRTMLGSNPSIVGTTVKINRLPVTIAGITSREFRGLEIDQPAIWLVMEQREHFYPDSAFLRAWDSDNVHMYGRLKDGVTPPAARESLRALMKGLHEQRPGDIRPDEWLEPSMGSQNFMTTRERAGFLSRMSLLGLLTTLVLMVAAANIGNLVLSRATGRSRELGVRVALGARRSRIARQLIIETLPLALLGAGGGLLFAYWTAAIIAARGGLPDNVSFAPDWQTLLVSLGMTVIALVVIGAVPAWKVSRQHLIAAVKDGGQQVSSSLDKARLRRLLMGAQVSGSCLILILSAMMVRSLQRVLSDDLGFEYEQSATLQAALGRYGYRGADAVAYWRSVQERVSQHPETAAVTLALAPPLGSRIQENTFEDVPGLEVVTNRITGTFFEVMSIPLLAGRTFGAGDEVTTTVIVSRILATEMFGTLDVVGRGFPRSKPVATIVGVVGDAHSIRLGSVRSSEAVPAAPRERLPASGDDRPRPRRRHGAAAGVEGSRGAGHARTARRRPAPRRLRAARQQLAPGQRHRLGHRCLDAGDRVPWDLRCGLVRRHAAHQGVRHSPGARRQAGRHRPFGDASRRVAGRARHRRWASPPRVRSVSPSPAGRFSSTRRTRPRMPLRWGCSSCPDSSPRSCRRSAS